MSEASQDEKSLQRKLNAITNTNFSTPNNVLSLDPIHKLEPNFYSTKFSGGTHGILDSYRLKDVHNISHENNNHNSDNNINKHNNINKPSFNVETMMLFLDGGITKTLRRKFIQGPTNKMNFLHKYQLTRPESITQHIELFNTIHDKHITRMIPSRDDINYMTQNAIHTGTLANHFGLGVNTILNAASDEQRDYWLPPALQTKIIISYAQTELGHGSNVRGLSTIAEYIKDYDCFIISTPTLQSIKWWPGALGCVATHAIVYASLLMDNGTKNYGIHSFIVQIRDENHRPLKGITIGDNGDCVGDNANDTGFLILDNVVIPRFNMLAKYQWIDDNGNYIKSKEKINNPKLHYLTMLATRAGMVVKQSGLLARAVTIASRYSFIRQQGFIHSDIVTTTENLLHNNNQNNNKNNNNNHNIMSNLRLPTTLLPQLKRNQPLPLYSQPNNTQLYNFQLPEYTLIEYSTQRTRILKQLSLTYILKSTGKYMTDLFTEFTGSDSMSSMDGLDLSLLSNLAPTTAGLKAVTTSLTHDGLNDLVHTLGGNGYLKSTGIAQLHLDYKWEIVAEGDRIPMLLQCGKFLLKNCNQSIIQYLLIQQQPTRSLQYQQQQIKNKSKINTNNHFLPFSPSIDYITYYSQLLCNNINSYQSNIILPPLPQIVNIYSLCFNQFYHFHTNPLVQNSITTTFYHTQQSSTSSFSSPIPTQSPHHPTIFNHHNNNHLNSLYQASLSYSPWFLLYLARLAQWKSLSIWSQILYQYCLQYQSITKCPFLSNLGSSSTATISSMSTTSSLTTNTTTTTPLSDDKNNINNNNNHPQLPYHAENYTSPQQEIIMNSISHLLVLATESYCKTFMFCTFINQILSLHTIDYTHPHHQKLALYLLQQDGSTVSPFITNLHAQINAQQKSSSSTTETTSSSQPTSSSPSTEQCPHQKEQLALPSNNFTIDINNTKVTKLITDYVSLIPVLTNLATFYITNEFMNDIPQTIYTPIDMNHQRHNHTTTSLNSCPFSSNTNNYTPSQQPSQCPRHKNQIINHNHHHSPQQQVQHSLASQHQTQPLHHHIPNNPLFQQTITHSRPIPSSSNNNIENPPSQLAKLTASLDQHNNYQSSTITSIQSSYQPPTLLQYHILSYFNITSSHLLIKDIIHCCDAFDISDAVLASTVGSYDGNVYEALFENALTAENNKSSPWSQDGYNKLFANRFDTDILIDGKNEQNDLYNTVFRNKQQQNDNNESKSSSATSITNTSTILPAKL